MQAMAFDGCYHDTDIDLATLSVLLEEGAARERAPRMTHLDQSPLKRKRFLKGTVGRIILQNNHVIDTYSRIVFPAIYIVFNFFYWGLYI